MEPSDFMASRIVRRAEVLRVTGLSRATIYRLIGQGLFPSPVKLGPGSVGWRESEIRDWLRSREPVPIDGASASPRDAAQPPRRRM